MRIDLKLPQKVLTLISPNNHNVVNQEYDDSNPWFWLDPVNSLLEQDHPRWPLAPLMLIIKIWYLYLFDSLVFANMGNYFHRLTTNQILDFFAHQNCIDFSPHFKLEGPTIQMSEVDQPTQCAQWKFCHCLILNIWWIKLYHTRLTAVGKAYNYAHHLNLNTPLGNATSYDG